MKNELNLKKFENKALEIAFIFPARPFYESDNINY